jgi:SAM-dependent methyltransferase
LTSPCHWLPWGRLDDAIRTGICPAPAALGDQFFGYLSQHPDELSEFTQAMEELSSLISTQVAGHLDLTGAKEVVDVGGGSGTLMAALLEGNPAIHGTIVERPEMIPIARGLLSARGVESRCDVVEGDFFQAGPAADVYILKLITHDWDDDHAVTILRNCARSLADVYILKLITHDWDDDHAVTILRNCARSLGAGGKVVLIDAVVPEHGNQPLPVLLDLHMHAVLGGRERTVDEFRKLLGGAGLSLDRIIETKSHAELLEARAATEEYR